MERSQGYPAGQQHTVDGLVLGGRRGLGFVCTSLVFLLGVGLRQFSNCFLLPPKMNHARTTRFCISTSPKPNGNLCARAHIDK